MANITSLMADIESLMATIKRRMPNIPSPMANIRLLMANIEIVMAKITSRYGGKYSGMAKILENPNQSHIRIFLAILAP